MVWKSSQVIWSSMHLYMQVMSSSWATWCLCWLAVKAMPVSSETTCPSEQHWSNRLFLQRSDYCCMCLSSSTALTSSVYSLWALVHCFFWVVICIVDWDLAGATLCTHPVHLVWHADWTYLGDQGLVAIFLAKSADRCLGSIWHHNHCH